MNVTSELLQVGCDWSGRPALESGQSNLFVACIIGVDDSEALAKQFAALRQRIKAQNPRKVVTELHGHQMPPEFIASALQIAMDLQTRVGLVLFDKESADQEGYLPSAGKMHALTALKIWPEFLAFGPVARFDYDTDISGKEHQKRFETELKRISSRIYPQNKMKAKSFPSDKSNAIQMADIVAYAFSRQEKGQKVEPEIARLLREIRRAPNTIIYEMDKWGK